MVFGRDGDGGDDETSTRLHLQVEMTRVETAVGGQTSVTLEQGTTRDRR
jgi:hypothetical protein